jgi:hypothetical protein
MPIRSVLPKTIAICSLSLVALAATAQQFQQPLVIATGSWPSGIVAADVNGDGRADLIYTDYGATATASTTHILLSNGDGTFALERHSPQRELRLLLRTSITTGTWISHGFGVRLDSAKLIWRWEKVTEPLHQPRSLAPSRFWERMHRSSAT